MTFETINIPEKEDFKTQLSNLEKNLNLNSEPNTLKIVEKYLKEKLGDDLRAKVSNLSRSSVYEAISINMNGRDVTEKKPFQANLKRKINTTPIQMIYIQKKKDNYNDVDRFFRSTTFSNDEKSKITDDTLLKIMDLLNIRYNQLYKKQETQIVQNKKEAFHKSTGMTINFLGIPFQHYTPSQVNDEDKEHLIEIINNAYQKLPSDLQGKLKHINIQVGHDESNESGHVINAKYTPTLFEKKLLFINEKYLVNDDLIPTIIHERIHLFDMHSETVKKLTSFQKDSIAGKFNGFDKGILDETRMNYEKSDRLDNAIQPNGISDENDVMRSKVYGDSDSYYDSEKYKVADLSTKIWRLTKLSNNPKREQ